MLVSTNLSVSGSLSLNSVASTTTSLSAMILESGLVKSRILGSMSLKGDNEYLPQIGLSFPSIFNLNTNTLNFTNQSLTVSLANQTANTFLSAPNGLSGTPSFRAIVASDIPTLNQSTTGNAATATALQTARTINGTSFNGSANITTANWGTARNITIGNTTKSVNGSANVSWSLSEIGVNIGSFVPYTGANQPININTQDFVSNGKLIRNENTFIHNNLINSNALASHYKLFKNVSSYSKGGGTSSGSVLMIKFPQTDTGVTAVMWNMVLDMFPSNGKKIKMSIRGYYSNTGIYSGVSVIEHNSDDIVDFVRLGNIDTGTTRDGYIVINFKTAVGDYFKANIPEFYTFIGYTPRLEDKSNYSISLISEASLPAISFYRTLQQSDFNRDPYLLNYNNLSNKPTIPTSSDFITTNTNQTGLSGNKTTSGTWTFNSQINTASHGNSSQWNTAYGWGNHAGLYLPLTGNAVSATALQTARTLTIGNTGKTFDGTANVSWSLAEIGAQSILTNPITGTGTTNFLSKFTGSGTLGNSQIFDNGTNVGIGTINPSYPLHVESNGFTQALIKGIEQTRSVELLILNNLNNGLNINVTGSAYASGTQNDIRLSPYGTGMQSISIGAARGSGVPIFTANAVLNRVGIGTTTPNSKLDVNGNTNITGSLVVNQSNNTINSIYTTDGTKVVPAYTFINDTDTGMYREGTNSLGLTAGGSARVVIRDTSLTLIPGSTSTGTHLLMSDSNYTVSHVSTSSITVGTATNAANIDITDDTSTSATYYPVFVSATSGSTAARVDSSTLTYNPSANLLRTGRLEATVAYRGATGSATFPAFSFSADTDTGMYRNLSDELGFSTGGTARMFINSSGSVGIGTTNPFAKLHVEGSFLVNTPNANFIVNPTNMITASVTSTTYGAGAGFELVDDSAAFGFNPFGDFRGVRANYLEGVWFANESGCKLGLQPVDNNLWSEGQVIQTADVPSNTSTPAAWIKIYNNDNSSFYFMPVYQ